MRSGLFHETRGCLEEALATNSLCDAGLGFDDRLLCASSICPEPSPEELKHKVELYLRNMFAFGPETKLLVGDLRKLGCPAC